MTRRVASPWLVPALPLVATLALAACAVGTRVAPDALSGEPAGSADAAGGDDSLGGRYIPSDEPDPEEEDVPLPPRPEDGASPADASGDSGQYKPRDAGGDAAKPVTDSGSDAGSGSRPSAGELLVTEVMFNPSGSEPDEEWIEVLSTASGPRSLSGLVLVDGSARTHTIGAGVVLGAGQRALLVRSRSAALAAKVPSAAILYDYGTGVSQGVQLTNSSTGSISIRNGATTVVSVPYGSWSLGVGNGESIQLDLETAQGASAKANWCVSARTWDSGADYGTPGAASDCP